MCVVFLFCFRSTVTVLRDQLSASRLVTRFRGANECLSASHTAMTLIYAEISFFSPWMEIQMTCLVLRVCGCIFWDENSNGLPRVFRLWDIFGPVFTELVSHWVVNALCVDDSCFVPKSFDRWLFDWFPQQIKTLFRFRCQDTFVKLQMAAHHSHLLARRPKNVSWKIWNKYLEGSPHAVSFAAWRVVARCLMLQLWAAIVSWNLKWDTDCNIKPQTERRKPCSSGSAAMSLKPC